MITELQKKKMAHFFNLFDTDKDGFLERADLERVVQNLAQAQNLAVDSALYKQIYTKWMFVWENLQKVADTNRDNLVSPEEWLRFIDMMLNSALIYQDVAESIGESTFDAVDINSDGIISLAEWRSFFQANQIDETMAEEIFARLDINGDGHISKEETMQLLHEFFFSNNPESPGNWFFGPLA